MLAKYFEQRLYRQQPTKQLLLTRLPFVIDILKGNYNVLLQQIRKYFAQSNTTSCYIGDRLIYLLYTLLEMRQSSRIRKCFIIISRILYLYLLSNYYLGKYKFKRTPSYTRASIASSRGLNIVVTFSISQPQFAHSRWHLLVSF